MTRQLHEDTMMEIMMMEIMVSCRWQDDHGAPKMEIKRSKMILAISCHFLIACDVYHVFTSYLLRTTVVNKMIPHNNFKKVFPLTVHRCDSSLFQNTTWWSGVLFRRSHTTGVRQIYTCKHLGWLDEPSMYRHGLGTQETERLSMSRTVDTINMKMFTDDD
jgi:hypothetical protein